MSRRQRALALRLVFTMAAVRDFARMGGLVGCGEDAGFIYMAYGFTYLRELELQQEAGFHPIDVIQNATGNNARILDLKDGRPVMRGGVQWTIKDGFVYSAPALLEDVKTMVAKARAAKG